MAIAISLSVMVWDFILKLCPDDISPRLGKDSLDDERIRVRRSR
jgi:hypothetical protein